MSGRLDSAAMQSVQELMLKEKRTQMAHPATLFLRRKFIEARGNREVVPVGVGSILNVGLNPDPVLLKYRQRSTSTPPEPTGSKNDAKVFVAGSPRRLSQISAVGHQLDQRYNVVKNPHGRGGGLTNLSQYPGDLRELLYSGTSGEYEGRYAYLKARKKQSSMFGATFGSFKGQSASMPMLTSQGVGWSLRGNGTSTWAPSIPPSDRGTLIRSRADDAPTLMKTFEIVNNRISMEKILGATKG